MGQQQQPAAARLAVEAAPLHVPQRRLGRRRRPDLEAIGGRDAGVGVSLHGQLEHVGDAEVQRLVGRADQPAAIAQHLEPLGKLAAVALPAIPAQRAQPPPAGPRLPVAFDVVVPLPAHHDADAGAVAGRGVAALVDAVDGNGHGHGVVAPGKVAQSQQPVEVEDGRPHAAVVETPRAINDLRHLGDACHGRPIVDVGLRRPA